MLRPARNGGITLTPPVANGDIRNPEIWTVPALLLDRARTLYPRLENTPIQTVSLGTRVLPEDGLTIADWITSNHRIYAVATHSGVTLAAHLGHAVAEEILTGNRHESLQAFGLSRFSRDKLSHGNAASSR